MKTTTMLLIEDLMNGGLTAGAGEMANLVGYREYNITPDSYIINYSDIRGFRLVGYIKGLTVEYAYVNYDIYFVEIDDNYFNAISKVFMNIIDSRDDREVIELLDELPTFKEVRTMASKKE